jgi:peptidoglycan/xylan/chitin deacetylase (PgdA/CDA1 family)
MPGSGARSVLHGVVKRVAAAGPKHRGVVVLLYHRVGGGSALEIDLDPGRFAEQLAVLAPRAVPLGDALDALDGPAPAVDPIAVTFDDGSADVVDVAVPLLVEAGVTATLYLATGYVEEQRELPGAGRPPSWAGLADAVATGRLEIGSHTHGHVLLDRLSPSEAAADLDRATGLIEDRLGVTPLDFAYPKAVAPSPAVDALVRERFRSAALAGTRPNPYGATDRFRLARSPVQVADGMRWFRAKADGGMAFEDTLRRRLNRRRYADATT